MWLDNVNREPCHAGLLGDVAVDFLVALDGDGSPSLVAVDLKPFAQGPLLSFKLFDFLQAGHWDPRQGIYTLDPEQLAADVMKAYAFKQALQAHHAGSSFNLEKVDILRTVRCFVAIDCVAQSSLEHSPAAEFLRRCYLSDISFDMTTGTGTSLHMMHNMTGRGLGIICSSKHLQTCFLSMLQVSPAWLSLMLVFSAEAYLVDWNPPNNLIDQNDWCRFSMS